MIDRSLLWRRIRRVWITLGLTATVIFVGWSLIAFRASDEAHGALSGEGPVRIDAASDVWSFLPADAAPETRAGFIFFPGSMVDPVAYAPLLRAVAEAGFPAYLVTLPKRGGFGGADDPQVPARARRVMQALNTPERWVIGGHSRGAVVAATFAAAAPAGLSGLVLIGTSHPRDVDLASLELPVTKIVGTRDGLASPEEVEANRPLLPAATRWVWIVGGNHSQFGWYGFQPGDRRPRIAAATQRRMMIDAVLSTLEAVS